MEFKLPNGKIVYIENVEGQYDDDITFTGYYLMDSSELGSDDDLISDADYAYIQEHYAAELYDEWYQNRICEAEYAYEGDR